jgi:hypothetical protein
VIRTVPQAQKWVDKVGLAVLFPKADVVLPSLWEQVSDTPVSDWNEELGFLWRTKDLLPAEGRACVGKHLAHLASCVAPRLVPTLVAANGEPLDDPVVDAIRELGPLTKPQLRAVTGLPAKHVERSLVLGHRQLVLTNAFLVDEGSSWGSLAHDLVSRKWQLPKRLPPRDQARRELAGLVLAQAGELTAADLAGVFKWRRKEAAAVLDELAESYDGGGFRIWAEP